MKINKLMMLFVTLMICSFSSFAALSDGVRASWTLDNNSLLDNSGNGNNLANYNTVSTTGKINEGRDFIATSSSYLTSTLTIGKAGTVNFWINPTSAKGTVRQNYFTSSNSDQSNFLTLQNWDDGNSYWGIKYSNTLYRFTVSDAFPSGWFMVTFVWDDSTGVYTLYWNDQQKATASDLPTLTDFGFNSYFGMSSAGNSPAASPSHYDGDMDEINMWDRAITSAEVSELYNSGVGTQIFDTTGGGDVPEDNPLTDNMVAYWKLNNDLSDSTGNGNALTNNFVNFVSGKIEEGANFDSTSDYLEAADSTNQFDFNSAFTISYWLKTTDSGSNQQIITKGNTGDYQYASNLVNGYAQGVMWQSAGTEHYSATGSTLINDGDWHHIAVVGDVTSGLYVYVDGVLDGSDTSATGSWDTSGAAPLRIGQRASGAASFIGQIDEVGIWNVALNITQIQELNNNELGNTYPFSAAGLLEVNIINITSNGELLINNSVFETRNIDFVVSYNVTNSDIGNFTTSKTTTLTNLLDGTYHAQFEVCYNSTCDTSGNYTYTINVTTPIQTNILDYYNYRTDWGFEVTSSVIADKIYYKFPDSGNMLICEDCTSGSVTGAGLPVYDEPYNVTTMAYVDGVWYNETWNFIVDVYDPVISHNIPSEINSYNWTDVEINVTDTNLDTCIFEISGNSFACSTFADYDFATNGNKSWSITAEDLAGNIVTETGTLLVNPPFYVYLVDNSSNSITNFEVNGTTYENYFSGNIYDYGLGTHAFTFSKVGFTSKNFSLTFTDTSDINITIGTSFANLQLFFYDLINLTPVTTTTLTIEIIGDSFSDVYTLTNQSNTTIIDPTIAAGSYTVIISSDDYETVTRKFEFANQEDLSLDFYLLELNTSEELADVIVEAQDQYGDIIKYIPIYQYIWDSSKQEYIEINLRETDYIGQTSYKVLLDTRLYTFCAEYEGSLYCNEDIIVNVKTDKIVVEIDTSQANNITSIFGTTFPYSLSNSSANNLTTISFTYNNPYLNMDEYCLEVYKFEKGRYTLLAPAQCSASHSASLSIDVVQNDSRTLYAKALVKQDNIYRMLDDLYVNSEYPFEEAMQDNGFYKFLIIFGIVGALVLGLNDKVQKVSLTHFGLMALSILTYIGFHNIMSFETVIIIIVVNIGAFLMISKQEQKQHSAKFSTINVILVTYMIFLFSLVTILGDFSDKGLLDDYGQSVIDEISDQDSDFKIFMNKVNSDYDSLRSGTQSGAWDLINIVFIKSIKFVDVFFDVMFSLFQIPTTILALIGITSNILSTLALLLDFLVSGWIMIYYFELLFK